MCSNKNASVKGEKRSVASWSAARWNESENENASDFYISNASRKATSRPLPWRPETDLHCATARTTAKCA